MQIELNELAALLRGNQQPQCNPAADAFWKPGKNYFIRTVTHHHTGELVAVGQQEIILAKAAWIADDGRLTDALKSGAFNEVEMFPPGAQVLIGRSTPWKSQPPFRRARNERRDCI